MSVHRIKAIFQIFKEMVKESIVGQPEAATNKEDENTLSINESIRDLNRQVNLILNLPFVFFHFCRECLTGIFQGNAV